MLPEHRLMRTAPLRSVRAGTSIDPRNLILRIGLHTVEIMAHTDMLQPLGLRPERVYDDSVTTRFHEGIHWRQLLGTTVGAFFYWVRHAREQELLANLHSLPTSRRGELLKARRRGRPIIALDTAGLPDPPIQLNEPADPVELMRCVFFDNFILETLFLDATPIEQPHASFEEIFASAMADTATALKDLHPIWGERSYADTQSLFRLADREIERVKVVDRQGADGPAAERELTTRDVLEAGAVANELMFGEFFAERRYYPKASGGLSVFTTSEGHDPDHFRRRTAELLDSGHGFAIRHFFSESGRKPADPHSWATLMIVSDFALNPPLPPVAGPEDVSRAWPDLYPPLRFHLASRAVKVLPGSPHPLEHRAVAWYMEELARLTGLTPPTRLVYRPPAAPLPDFAAILNEEREEELYEKRISYYEFLLWCQDRLWRQRVEDLRFVVAPAYLAHEFWDSDPGAFWRLLSGFGSRPPIMTDPEGHLDHALGSTVRFGTWFALSMWSWGLTQDLAFGCGEPDGLGYPSELLKSQTAADRVRRDLALAIGEDPWAAAA